MNAMPKTIDFIPADSAIQALTLPVDWHLRGGAVTGALPDCLPALPPLDRGVEPGTVLGGRYRLHHLLGWGGMGEVYQGWDQVLERPVAVKLLPARWEHT